MNFLLLFLRVWVWHLNYYNLLHQLHMSNIYFYAFINFFFSIIYSFFNSMNWHLGFYSYVIWFSTWFYSTPNYVIFLWTLFYFLILILFLILHETGSYQGEGITAEEEQLARWGGPYTVRREKKWEKKGEKQMPRKQQTDLSSNLSPISKSLTSKILIYSLCKISSHLLNQRHSLRLLNQWASPTKEQKENTIRHRNRQRGPDSLPRAILKWKKTTNYWIWAAAAVVSTAACSARIPLSPLKIETRVKWVTGQFSAWWASRSNLRRKLSYWNDRNCRGFPIRSM